MKRARSPNYPYIDLETAIGRATSMSDFTGKHEVGIEDLYKEAWGFTGVTGSSKKTLAALKYFGLASQPHGSSKARLTDLALRIIHGLPGSVEQREAIQAAFLSPKIYKYCWEKWSDDQVAPAAMKSHLILEKGFNESTVSGFIKDYRSSLDFAGMIAEDDEDEADLAEDLVGQLVQWSSQGVLQFETPRRVTGLTPDGKYAYIEGSQSGVLISELEVVEGSHDNSVPPPNPEFRELLSNSDLKPRPAHKEEVFSLGSGQVTLQFPDEMSPNEFEDLTDWFVLIHRKIGRGVSLDEVPRLARQE
ncbi:MAG: hypothetical protein AAF662_01420 [Pseudomonadota bacterium]